MFGGLIEKSTLRVLISPTWGRVRTNATRCIHRSAWRDCLETPKGLHYGVSRACGTGQKGTIWTLRATGKRAIRPAQRVSRQSLEGVFSEVRRINVRFPFRSCILPKFVA